jgi:hypothetical protein
MELQSFLKIWVRNVLELVENFGQFNGKFDGAVVQHSLGFSAKGSGFESRPRPSESMKLFSSYKLIPSTQNSTNVDSLELNL